MSDREKAIQILNEIPDYRIGYIVSYLQGYLPGSLHGVTDGEEIPNAETLEAIREGDEMLENGTGQRFEGSTEDFFNMILEEQ